MEFLHNLPEDIFHSIGQTFPSNLQIILHIWFSSSILLHLVADEEKIVK